MITNKEISKLAKKLRDQIEADRKLEEQGHVFDYSFMDDWPEADDDESATTAIFLNKPKKQKKQNKK